jgi:hypothetical protein
MNLFNLVEPANLIRFVKNAGVEMLQILLFLSCDIKKSKTSAKISENNWSNRYQWSHL